MYYDYHMHCSFSDDSKTPMEDMINKSIELGLKEICFTDHVDYSIISNNIEKDNLINYEEYFKNIEYFKEKYKNKITIKKGIEMGLQNHILSKCSDDIRSNDFDFVIGSIHTINKSELIKRDFYKDKSQFEAYKQYYDILYNIISKFNDYSVIGHMDIVKRYGDLNNIIDDKIFENEIDKILRKIIDNGKGIEVNTSCFRYGLPDLTPSSYILKRYRQLGGEIITTGSDSHNPNQIAHEFKKIYKGLEEMGYKYICTFNKMEPNFIKL